MSNITDLIQSRWSHIRNNFKTTHGELSDADLNYQGNQDDLLERISSKTGQSKDAIANEIYYLNTKTI